jgi:hypothetical protein
MTFLGLIAALLLALTMGPWSALAAGDPPSAANANKASTSATGGESNVPPGVKHFANGIPIGTVITMSNWQQYKQFMPDGMVDLFQGTYFWKMPADVQMKVGPTLLYPLPQGYRDATEKYGSQTRVDLLPNGHYHLANYVAGLPFANPQNPDKGWKILADEWYGPIPRIAVGAPETGLGHSCALDRFGNLSCLKFAYVYRMLSHIWNIGHPVTEPAAGGAWYTEWLMIEWPEQSKYTADLTIFWQNDQKDESDYVFVPALRRTLALSSTARCAPVFGTDYTHDDARAGFNGGTAIFQAKWLREQKILGLTDITTADGTFPQNYDLPLAWAKPSWGNWSVRDTDVIDVRRIPSLAPGYCYGKRIMYVDKHFHHELWTDLYDTNMKLWKVMSFMARPGNIHGQISTIVGSVWVGMWDIQNDHATLAFTADGPGRDIVVDGKVPPQYDNISKYSTPGGLMQIMR